MLTLLVTKRALPQAADIVFIFFINVVVQWDGGRAPKPEQLSSSDGRVRHFPVLEGLVWVRVEVACENCCRGIR